MKKDSAGKLAILAASVALGIGHLGAEEAKKPLEEGPMQIGGSSPVGTAEMVQTINPKSPPMTKAVCSVAARRSALSSESASSAPGAA